MSALVIHGIQLLGQFSRAMKLWMLAAVDVNMWKEHWCVVKVVLSEAISVVLAT